MESLPKIVPTNHLRYFWFYTDETLKITSLVARYDEAGQKKRFHQFQILENGEWAEGTPIPLPIYGIHSLNNKDPDQNVYIFEGEKCAAAAHCCHLPALTSMMGAMQAEKADWALLARFRYVKNFVLVPDNDEPGIAYARSVFEAIKKSCPKSSVWICQLSLEKVGDDFIDWIQSIEIRPEKWDGFQRIDAPYSHYIQITFEKHVKDHRVPAEHFFGAKAEGMFLSDPQPITETITEVLPCPIHFFPQAIRNWITALASQMQVPVDYLAAPLIVYCGSLIGRKRKLLLRPGTNWIEYPNLWGMIIGRPSIMKSPPMKAVQSPLTKLAAKARKDYEKAHEEYLSKSKIWETINAEESKFNKKKIGKRLKEETPENILENASHSKPPALLKKPIWKRYQTQDATIEKLGELMIENPQGMMLFRDELIGLLSGFKKSGKEADRQFFLESWSGKEEWYVDRIMRGSLYIPAICLSIFGSVQPGPIAAYVHAAIKGGAKDDGFIQRFQVVVWPDPIKNWELVQIDSINFLEEAVSSIFKFLDSLQFDSEGNPISLQFSSNAQKLFDSWQTGLENKLRNNSLFPHMESHLGKYKKLLPALAIIAEHLQIQPDQQDIIEISQDSLEKSIDFAKYLESHSARLYSCGLNVVPEAARLLLKKIGEGKIVPPFTARDIYHGNHWAGLSNAEDVKEVLTYLLEKGYLHQDVVKTGGRSTIKYLVHPKCLPK